MPCAAYHHFYLFFVGPSSFLRRRRPPLHAPRCCAPTYLHLPTTILHHAAHCTPLQHFSHHLLHRAHTPLHTLHLHARTTAARCRCTHTRTRLLPRTIYALRDFWSSSWVFSSVFFGSFMVMVPPAFALPATWPARLALHARAPSLLPRATLRFSSLPPARPHISASSFLRAAHAADARVPPSTRASSRARLARTPAYACVLSHAITCATSACRRRHFHHHRTAAIPRWRFYILLPCRALSYGARSLPAYRAGAPPRGALFLLRASAAPAAAGRAPRFCWRSRAGGARRRRRRPLAHRASRARRAVRTAAKQRRAVVFRRRRLSHVASSIVAFCCWYRHADRRVHGAQAAPGALHAQRVQPTRTLPTRCPHRTACSAAGGRSAGVLGGARGRRRSAASGERRRRARDRRACHRHRRHGGEQGGVSSIQVRDLVAAGGRRPGARAAHPPYTICLPGASPVAPGP